LGKNQALVNKVIKSFASKIPEHLFYTALPQLLSRVIHNDIETSKNVALILRTVLAKYPRQSLWSCGWLRFSKSKEKMQAGEVSIAHPIDSNESLYYNRISYEYCLLLYTSYPGYFSWCAEDVAEFGEGKTDATYAQYIKEPFPILYFPRSVSRRFRTAGLDLNVLKWNPSIVHHHFLIPINSVSGICQRVTLLL